MEDNYKNLLLTKYPMLTYLTYGKSDYVGIIQNVDDAITTIYDLGSVKTDADKIEFLQLAEIWWDESNRQVPINVFLRLEWYGFRSTLKTLNSKDVDIKVGPYLSLKEMALKRSKRRSITLVRRVN
jgi:hypothetical protein